MEDYIVVKEVRLKITAKNRKEAAKYASQWKGESEKRFSDGLNIEWDGKSRRVDINTA